MLPQPKLVLSPYMDLYDRLIPKDHEFRQILDLVDFSFIYEELHEKYCPDNGRMAKDPVQLFKYLFLKAYFDLSDVDLVERARYDMSCKFFLGLAPEDDVIHPSLLSKFRRQRLKDTDLLDLLLAKSVHIAQEQGLLKGKGIIMDSVHTASRYNRKTPAQYLIEKTKAIRKTIYTAVPALKENMPVKPKEEEFGEQKSYSEELVKYLKEQPETQALAALREKVNLLEEILDDIDNSHNTSDDPDAKVGHKTADSSFYGYKSHLAMTEERIITAAVITTGEKTDGKYMEELVEKTEAAGYEVEEVTGDRAYSERQNLIYTEEKGIRLYSRLSKNVTHEPTTKIKGFEYNKDADMYMCPAGHMSVKKKYNKKGTSNENPQMRYYFDVEKCRNCPKRDGCYKEGAKTKTYTVKIKSPEHLKQMDFQETEEFKERIKERYKIEAKNGELKNAYGYDQARSSGLESMELQGAVTLFTVNMRRILRLMEMK